MFEIVLVEPEIPPNTGNIIRLCANTGCRLHLIEPLGFKLDDTRLRRAGLDYHEWASLTCYPTLTRFLTAFSHRRHFLFTTHASRSYTELSYAPGDCLVFGAETHGVSSENSALFPADHRVRLPMQAQSRSLNLSNTVAVAVYEAWRQNGFTLPA